MKHKLLIGLTILLLCAALFFYRDRLPAVLSHDSPGDNANQQETIDPANKSREVVSAASKQLLLRASERLKNWPALEANVRHRIDLFGEQLVGPGRYVQAGQGSPKARLELNFHADDFDSQVTQINDGRFLYIKSDSDKDAPMQRIDLSRLSPEKNEDPTLGSGATRWMAMGGLAYLLQQLAEDFEFEEARKEQLDAIDVLVFKGKWKPARIAEVCGKLKVLDKDGRVRFDKLPDQLPTHVQITLGNEEPLRLFPYQIIYLKQTSDKSGRITQTPIATFEFFDVHPVAQLDPATFHIEKDATRLTDVTDTVLKTIGDETKQR